MNDQATCACYWCDRGIEHLASHKRWVEISQIDDILMVSCYTCGHIEPRDEAKHLNVINIG